ncbi:MAG: GUN4 domain-containing protein [Nostoc sp.]|uniref:GUN4 domain-containing protein n=1 Tax=Nostoc sp. TaxID=1180 RepID=UPI002FF96E17
MLLSPQKPPVKSRLEQTPKEIEYRKKVEGYVYNDRLSEPYNEISKINQTNLKTIRERIGLDPDKAKLIENDVLQLRCQRHEEYKQNLQEYHKLAMESLEKEEFFSDDILSGLKELKNNLGLSDKDAEEILLYAELEYSLQKGEWREADETTKNLLLKVVNVQENYLNENNFKQIPCKDIRKIDKLWKDHSNGLFGYSVQRDIWQKVKERPEVKDILYDFVAEVGWGY